MILSPEEEESVILNTFQIDVIMLYRDKYVHGHQQQRQTCSFSNVNLIREGIHIHTQKDHVDCVDSIRSFLVPVSWYSTDCFYAVAAIVCILS